MFARKKSGITLIALIITIIVMLILVGVTVNVALNGGLFDNARNASSQTQVEKEKELLYMAATGAYSAVAGEVDFSTITLPEEFEEIAPGTYKNTETGNEYTVNKNTCEVTERNDEPVEETYSFKLSDLGSDFIFNSEGYMHFDLDILNFNGKSLSDLSKDSNYGLGGVAFLIDCGDVHIQDFYLVYIGIDDLGTQTQYLISFSLEKAYGELKLIVGVFERESREGEPVEALKNRDDAEAFLTEYGDATFTLVKTTGIEIPD